MKSINKSTSTPARLRNGFWRGGNGRSSDTDTVGSSEASVSLDSHGRPVRVFSPHNEDTSPPTIVRSDTRKLGTLSGVFIPCISNIIGIILFLRLTNITGQAGTIYTTLIVLASTLSTFLTALSLSAIATNGEIQAGGPYYVISRTLGIEIGGPVGLLFYLGTTLATSMYVLGAVEAIQRSVSFQFDARWASLILVWAVASVVSIGVRYINMASNFFLVTVITSLFCAILGASLFASGSFYGLLQPQDRVFMDNLWPHYQPDPVTEKTPDFWSLLAIFYPSVTGILAGSNRSAVLASPSTSIPQGTLAAIGFTTTIYLVVIWLYGSTMANPVLINDKFVVAAVSWPYDQVVAVGVIFSSIGAALQTCAGAPRVLAAIALDDALPFLAWLKPPGPDDEPTKAVWFTWLLASLPTLAGNLDHITPFVTMFFLLMYAGINLSCFFLGFLKTPGFRPTFRYFHWSMSLFGFIWCLGLVGLVINWLSALIVFVIFVILYAYTKKQRAQKEWGDVGNVIRYVIANSALRALAGTQFTDFHAKNWRPQLLTVVDTDVCGNPTNLHVLALASQLKHGADGVHIVTSVMNRNDGLEKYETCELIDHSKKLLKNHMNVHGLDGFAQVMSTTQKTSQAIWSAVVHAGLGPLSPNTVLLSYSSERRDEESKEDYIQTLRGIMNLKKALILFKGAPGYPPSKEHHLTNQATASIDVWWVVHDGGLLLLLPYLLSKTDVYESVKLRLFAVTSSATENPDRLRDCVIDHLRRVRIRATVHVVDLSDTTIAEDMRERDVTSHLSQSTGSRRENTHHMTVGEVFSHHAYEVPYHAVSEDVENGGEYNEPGSPSFAKIPKESNSAMQRNERLRTARAFNHALKQFSNRASLIVTNLPLVRSEEPADEFFDYVDTMSDGVKNMLFVRGSGIEVITTYV
jgi:potassium/chloride transporter 4/5/6